MRKSLMTMVFGVASSGGLAAMAAAYSLAWDWAFPAGAPPTDRDNVVRHALPGTPLRFTSAQVYDPQHAVDWRPAAHPPMPDAVAIGKGAAFACGYCHLPTGEGRPENSALAGLPADYIKRQVIAFADGTRQAARPGSLPAMTMARIAKTATGGVVQGAAAYFSELRFRSHVRVVEAETIPHAEARSWTYVLATDGAKEPLGQKIIEAPASFIDFELRDPAMSYTAYVPRGAVAEGKSLAMSGGPAAQSCAACHGTTMRGGVAPPLAGRSPTMIARQLMAFKLGTRANPEAAPMRIVAAKLGDRQIIALSAYMATLTP